MLKPFLILSALVLIGASAPAPQAPPPQASPPQTAPPPQAPPPQAQPPSSAAPAPEATAPAFKIPPEAVNQANPVKPTPESQARAKQIYGYECAMCHGANGDGAGDLAKNMKEKMADFRDPSSLKGETDGALFYIIKNGMGDMEGEGPRVKTDEAWNLVIYLRSLSKGQAAAASGPQ